jgi:3-oxoacyl-[acyl-carrier protein] reductase
VDVPDRRSALITGASAGLAAGIAPALARDGFAHVAITYRTTAPDATIAAIAASGASASALRVDFLGDPASIAGALAEHAQAHGPFDTLVHAVGPMILKRFERLTLDDYQAMFDGNVRSAVLAAQAVLPSMRAAGFGRLIFFGSLDAQETRPFRGFAFYGAAKSALTAFARTLAVEEARHGITVNVVVPGDIREKSIDRAAALQREGRSPRRRSGSYEDVADVVRFLAAPERDFVTGAVIAVSGGLTQADERNEPAE